MGEEGCIPRSGCSRLKISLSVCVVFLVSFPCKNRLLQHCNLTEIITHPPFAWSHMTDLFINSEFPKASG